MSDEPDDAGEPEPCGVCGAPEGFISREGDDLLLCRACLDVESDYLLEVLAYRVRAALDAGNPYEAESLVTIATWLRAVEGQPKGDF